MNPETVKKSVRERYGQLAAINKSGGCSCGSAGCCGSPSGDYASAIGYSEAEAGSAPDGANLGLGCGNPQAIAALKPGETVLDLGSGGGFDCFLAARQVGATGKVIGVDMTPEMVAKARENIKKAEGSEFDNVEFRLGEIEHLPVADESVDAIISNCVINLSAEKEKVFREAYRVLKPGGRLAILDVVAIKPLPESIRNDLIAVAACIGGAETIDGLRRCLETAGYEQIQITPLGISQKLIDHWLPGKEIGDYVRSATILAVKPQEKTQSALASGKKTERVDAREIRERVYHGLRSGQHCAETVSQTILDIFSPNATTPAVHCAAGFGGGIGGTFEEVCGALSGGILALGSLLGRECPNSNHLLLGQLVNRFRNRFLAEFGSTNCQTLRMGFTGKNVDFGCARLSARAANILADMLHGFEEETGGAVAVWTEESSEEGCGNGCPLKALS